MVVLTRRGKVKRPLLSRPQAGFSPPSTSTKPSSHPSPPTNARPSQPILPRGVALVDVLSWTSVVREVESADGIALERVEFIPAEVLVTDGRTDWIIDISDRAREIAGAAGYRSPT